MDTATLRISKFEPKFENIDIAKIKGAFAVVIGEDGPIHTEVMNIAQIRKAWGQGTAYSSGKSTAHNNFADEMAKKTVINRACKMFANTSDDSDLLIAAFNNSTDSEWDGNREPGNNVQEIIDVSANKEVIDITPISKEYEVSKETAFQEDPGF